MNFASKFAPTLLLFALFLSPLVSYAQVQDDITSYDSSVNAGDFEFEISPENPGPRQQVRIHVTSNLVDTNRYPISWSVDGVTVLSGIGARTITVTTKDYGQTVQVSMSIKLIESVVTKQIILTPQDSTILWEAVDSYVPPFYQGKKLGSYESIVRIVSIPNFLGGASSSTKSAIYNWMRNDGVVKDVGGFGRDSLLIQHNSVRKSEKIEVTASNIEGSSSATSKIYVPFFKPGILFYEENDVTGLRSPLAKRNIYFTRPSMTIVAEPYFFSTLTGNPNVLTFNWTMNGVKIPIPNIRFPQKLQLQNPGTAGVSQLGLSIENDSRIYQLAGADLTVTYNESE